MKKTNKNGFTPISKEDYITLYLKSNRGATRKEIDDGIKEALQDYKCGVQCDCGNSIWVVGSAVAGNGCFTCITGESFPDDDYEIDQAMK